MVKSKKYKRYQVTINVILFFVTLIMFLPLVLLFMSSISSESSLLVYGYSFIPKEFSLEAYRYILNNKETIFNAYGVTVLSTLVGTTVNILMSAMLAYPLSIKNLPFKRILNFYIVFTMLFSGGLVPSYIMWTGTFHIKNTIWALIVPNFMLSAMNVMLIRTYFLNSIPEEIYEAAKIDGTSYFKIFTRITMPLGKPILVTMTLFSGITYWNDWTNGLYYINDPKMFSIQTLLNKMILDIQAIQANSAAAASSAAMAVPHVSIRMAIAFVALFPILIIFPFLQKYFESGIAMGAVKG